MYIMYDESKRNRIIYDSFMHMTRTSSNQKVNSIERNEETSSIVKMFATNKINVTLAANLRG